MALPSHSSSSLFVSAANSQLARLEKEHDQFLNNADHHNIQLTHEYAHAIRRAAVVHRAITDILSLPSSPSSPSSDTSSNLRNYLRALLPQLETALRDCNYQALFQLSTAAQHVLDNTIAGTTSYFEPINPIDPIDNDVITAPAVTSFSGPLATRSVSPSEHVSSIVIPSEVDDHDDFEALGRNNVYVEDGARSKNLSRSRRRNANLFNFSMSNLSRRDKVVIFLYILMILASIVCIAIITADFISESINPSGFIKSSLETNLTAPVVTICLSQTGVPFSRLQLFNYTDAEGNVFRGADPFGPQDARVSPEFSLVVDRFWENPDSENCTEKIGDFYPFPLASLQSLMDGKTQTKCRQCYRVGAKENSVSNSTAFQRSSVLSLYTDNYFLQCLKSVGGLNEPSMQFMFDQLVEKRAAMEANDVLSVSSEVSTSVSNLNRSDFEKMTSEQICNAFYFAFFPKATKRNDSSTDIRYAYNGTNWNPIGQGPYLRVLNKSNGFLPTESLQMFVEANETAQAILPGNPSSGNFTRTLGEESDMILIGPNTQTYATFRMVDVFGRKRFDVASSTSNLWQSDITPIFGYWLVYRIYYNYNRFVTDTYYQDSTYPAGQWIVDVTGYASLFTGASIFSLLLLPLLKAVRRSEKQQLLQRKPEGYVWSKYRPELYHTDVPLVGVKGRSGNGPGDATGRRNIASAKRAESSNVLLPGYNI